MNTFSYLFNGTVVLPEQRTLFYMLALSITRPARLFIFHQQLAVFHKDLFSKQIVFYGLCRGSPQPLQSLG